MPVFWTAVQFLSGYVLGFHNWRELIVRSHKILWKTKLFLHQMLTILLPNLREVHSQISYRTCIPTCVCIGQECFYIFILPLYSVEQLSVMFIAVWFCVILQPCCSSRKTNRLCSPDPLFPTLLNSSPTPLTE